MSFALSPLRIATRAPLLSSSATLARAFSTSRPSQLARLTLVGRLGADPEITTTKNGSEVIKYVVGTSYGPRERRQTSWFRVACFAAQGTPARDKLIALSKGYVSLSTWPIRET
jgi:Single-strand binding protein family